MSKNDHDVYRFAPSPTGLLHVGGLRTAVFNWILAKSEGGKFLLRIEDTDQERSDEAATQQIMRSLNWLEIYWDSEPVYQSKQITRHREIIQLLLKSGQAYRCFCSHEKLEAMSLRARDEKQRYIYDGTCRDLPETQIVKNLAEEKPYVVRLRAPQGRTSYQDGVYGEVTVENAEIGDIILLRSNNTPVYHIAVVVDDHDMGVTHVLRGEDHLSNTPKQILIYQALGWPVPKFSHLPLILGPDKRILSKRHGASSVEEFKNQGILPEVLFNYLCLLGWAPGKNREILSRDEIIGLFSISRVNKANAVFDYQKLLWINGKYLADLDPSDLFERTKSRLDSHYVAQVQADKESFLHLLDLLKIRAKTLNELVDAACFYFTDPESYEEKGVEKYFQSGNGLNYLQDLRSVLNDTTEFCAENLEKVIRRYAEGQETDAGKVIHPLRLALTGKTASPGIFDVLTILGREKVMRRLGIAIDYIKQANQDNQNTSSM